MFRVIPDLISVITGFLPPWAMALLGVVVAAIAIPAYLRSIRTKQIKNRLRWYGRAHSDDERQRWADEAFELANGEGLKLVALAEEALKLNQHLNFKRATGMLREMGGYELDLKRMDEATKKEKPRYRHPVEAAVVIEKLIDEEMYGEASERLSEAMKLFPGDDDLADIEHRLRQKAAS